MDPEIAALAGSAGTTIVTLAATDAWERARDGLVALWRRVRPEGADAVGDELATTRDELANTPPEDTETEGELVAQWRGRVRRLLATHPEVADELRDLLTELTEEQDGPPAAGPTITQHATASGHARVYQAGGDMRIG
ncbi:hypothetical protein E1265_04845 [Streptomyces sp. 8K308]|uniref:hypothetical protein n=1 Tax=Streptomyces sp. 8K308 TaxID=2530388 RepID=UPI00104DC82B|nr:hypothetical protein [Streptomyces sp. 8K308]TDC26255.1 hypothetical protein E1265_04845 [Streptomyces sp. 8K308]